MDKVKEGHDVTDVETKFSKGYEKRKKSIQKTLYPKNKNID